MKTYLRVRRLRAIGNTDGVVVLHSPVILCLVFQRSSEGESFFLFLFEVMLFMLCQFLETS